MLVVPALMMAPMTENDIASVQLIEEEIFTAPWPKNAYVNELRYNTKATYVVARHADEIVGYGGVWQVGHECHVTTIGVANSFQGKGFGKALFAHLITLGYGQHARWMTLEVRPTNKGAILLYESFGFSVLGRRRSYYGDNGEDALVMWSGVLMRPSFIARFKEVAEGLSDVIAVDMSDVP